MVQVPPGSSLGRPRTLPFRDVASGQAVASVSRAGFCNQTGLWAGVGNVLCAQSRLLHLGWAVPTTRPPRQHILQVLSCGPRGPGHIRAPIHVFIYFFIHLL